MLAKFGSRADSPQAQPVDPVHAEILQRVRFLLEQRDIRGVVEHLNLHSEFRFTKVSRFDPPFLRSVYLYDKTQRGTVDPTTQMADDSYSAIIRRDKRPFYTEDSLMDSRLVSHPLRKQVRCYVGAPIMLSGGGIWGVLAHCDTSPRKVPAGEADLLLQVAELLSQELFANKPAT